MTNSEERVCDANFCYCIDPPDRDIPSCTFTESDDSPLCVLTTHLDEYDPAFAITTQVDADVKVDGRCVRVCSCVFHMACACGERLSVCPTTNHHEIVRLACLPKRACVCAAALSFVPAAAVPAPQHHVPGPQWSNYYLNVCRSGRLLSH